MGNRTSSGCGLDGHFFQPVTSHCQEGSQPSGCPVDHSKFKREDGGKNSSAVSTCPVRGGSSSESVSMGASGGGGAGGGCPVKHKGEGQKGEMYNVYNQKIDPSNMMPENPNQVPAPGQTVPITTERVKSNIPKGGTEGDTWEYPSPQMFYNALHRKGKKDDFQEKDADVVVAIHNNMNERTWMSLMEWEKHFHGNENAKLIRFMGRPDELSPKARLKSWLGYPLPFDRHDWYIERDGQEVRYIIDYYHSEERGKEDKVPTLMSATDIKSISMDVRPAVDSAGAVLERVRWFPKRAFAAMKEARTTRKVSAPESAADREDEQSSDSQSREGDEAESVNLAVEKLGPKKAKKLDKAKKHCAPRFEDVTSCDSPEACRQAHMALVYCLATRLCKKEAKQFMATMESKDANEQEVGDSFDRMSACLKKFTEG